MSSCSSHRLCSSMFVLCCGATEHIMPTLSTVYANQAGAHQLSCTPLGCLLPLRQLFQAALHCSELVTVLLLQALALLCSSHFYSLQFLCCNKTIVVIAPPSQPSSLGRAQQM